MSANRFVNISGELKTPIIGYLQIFQNGTQIDTAEIVYMDMSTMLRVSLDLQPLDETEQFAANCIRRLQENWIPDGVYADEDENWQCRYCPVVAACEAMR